MDEFEIDRWYWDKEHGKFREWDVPVVFRGALLAEWDNNEWLREHGVGRCTDEASVYETESGKIILRRLCEMDKGPGHAYGGQTVKVYPDFAAFVRGIRRDEDGPIDILRAMQEQAGREWRERIE